MSTVHCYFCGGPACKYENYKTWIHDASHPNAIEGLYSNWITPFILATQRPSTRIIKEYNLIEAFKSLGIKSIYNLQLAYEHKACGDGIDDRGGSGFSYVPEDFMEEGISHYGFGWPDMDVPDKAHMLKIVQVMSHDLDTMGGKIAVHCHAGLGRTGLTIACYLVYAQNKTPHEAIQCVRDKRPRSVQTSKQQAFVHQFKDYLLTLNAIYPMKISRPAYISHISISPKILSEDHDDVEQNASVTTVLATQTVKLSDVVVPAISFDQMILNQQLFLHGMEVRTFWNVPKILKILTSRLKWVLNRSDGEKLSLSIQILHRVSAFNYISDTLKLPATLTSVMTEINFGNLSVLDPPPPDKASKESVMEYSQLLIDMLLCWISLLKEPLLSDTLANTVVATFETESASKNEPYSLNSILLKIEALDKRVFWSLNVLVDFFRELSLNDIFAKTKMSKEVQNTESIYRIATLMTSLRSSNVPVAKQTATEPHIIDEKKNPLSEVQRTADGSPDTEILPNLPPKSPVSQFKSIWSITPGNRNRVASEPVHATVSVPPTTGAKSTGFKLFMSVQSQLPVATVWGLTRFLKCMIDNVSVHEETRWK